MSNNKETRSAQIEVRGADSMTIGGYASVFQSRADLGFFTEEISRSAFENADMNQVFALFNHDNNKVLGRSSSGTLRLTVDERGLRYDVDLPNTETGREVYELVKRGDISQSSFGFTVAEDKWEMRDGKQHRTITKVGRLFDVSPVTFPAYNDTSVAKRSLDALMAHPDGTDDDDEDFQKAKRQRRLRLLKAVSTN